MIIVPGQSGKDLCDSQLGVTRRDILRVGGSGLLGLGLGSMLELQAVSARGAEASRGPGWGKAKSIIMVYLQGGPSHLDLWDPKENVPDNVRSVFKPIATKVARNPGHRDLAQAVGDHRQVHLHPLDELYAQRAVQSHGGHLPDDDGLHDGQGQPVGSARAAQPERFPQFWLPAHSPAATDGADAAVRDAAAAAARKQRRGQGRIRRLSGQSLRSLHALSRRRRHGHGQAGPDQGRRPAVAARGLCPAAPAPGASSATHSTPACSRSIRRCPISNSTNITIARYR